MMLSFKQYITEDGDLDTQLRKLGLKRTNKYGKIGKEIGGEIYLHKQYENTLPADLLKRAKNAIPEGFEYQVVKFNPKTETFSFIQSKDFDTNPEPSVNGGLTVKADGTSKKFPDSGWIYHHKFLWVADDYTGFDVEESKQRSLQWSSLDGVDKARIGQRKHWDDNVIPRLKESEEFPLAGEVVSGLTVRSEVPNTGSIRASITNYTTLKGIREVPMSAFNGEYEVTSRTKKLAEEIEETKEINPLIVVIDSDGPYILEGAHRFDALGILKVKSFPAMVVLDED